MGCDPDAETAMLPAITDTERYRRERTAQTLIWKFQFNNPQPIDLEYDERNIIIRALEQLIRNV